MQVPDPRGRKGRRHPLVAMLATVCCGILSGHCGYEAIAQWIHAQEVPLWHAPGFTRPPPTWSCFWDLLMALDPAALNDALLRWLREGLGLDVSDDEAQELVIDGKALRGSKSRHQRALQTLALLNARTGGILLEHPVDPTTSEAKAALSLLKALVLEGKVIVGDAGYCDREICQEIVDSGGDDFVLVKDNQPTLHKAAPQAFVISRSVSPLPEALGV
jgi:hypothetical protein